MDIRIRPENKEDYEAVFQINTLAFGQEAEAKLVDRLRNSASFIPELSLAALADGIIAGYILFTKIKIVNSGNIAHESLALAPLAVMPAFQKKGLGSALVWAGLEKARQLDFKSVIVLGHEEYYPKFGFRPASLWNIRTSYKVPDERYMAIELAPGGLKGVSGLVVYDKEFDN